MSNKSKLVVLAKSELSLIYLQQNWAASPMSMRVGRQDLLWSPQYDVSS